MIEVENSFFSEREAGTYKMNVQVKAKGNNNYKTAVKTVKLKVVVK